MDSKYKRLDLRKCPGLKEWEKGYLSGINDIRNELFFNYKDNKFIDMILNFCDDYQDKIIKEYKNG